MGCIYSRYRLKNCTCKNTQVFSFNNFKTKAKVVKVYDGDTIWVAFNYKGKYVRIKIRLYGIDTPELRSKHNLEKEKAIDAREYLKRMIFNKIITLECGKFDKYGRLLGKIYYNNIYVNQKMIEMGLGIAYNGGTKK
tara:strand:- start:244 stop:654 length:411 start_codon:yes stop_codon:yes gene_type:complete